MKLETEAVIFGSGGIVVGVSTWTGVKFMPFFAALDQNTVIVIGALMGVLATGLTGVLGALSKGLLNALREYRELNAKTDAGKLHECLDHTLELKDHLTEIRAAHQAMKDLADGRGLEITILREERDMLRRERDQYREEVRALMTEHKQLIEQNHKMAEQLTRSNEFLIVKQTPDA
jgi:FtsZ-binding cell division protein ZapB